MAKTEDSDLPFDQLYRVLISDNSLINAGISKGDILKLCRSSTFREGNLAAVETPDGLFVAHIYRQRKGRVMLVGAHEKCQPRTYQRERVKVLGVWPCPEGWPDWIPG